MTLLYSVTSFKEDAVPFDEFESIWEQKKSTYRTFNVMTSQGVIVQHHDSLADAFDEHESVFRVLKERGFSDEDVEMIMYDEDVPIAYNGVDGEWHESGASVDVIEIIDDSRRMKIVDLPSGAQLVYR